MHCSPVCTTSYLSDPVEVKLFFCTPPMLFQNSLLFITTNSSGIFNHSRCFAMRKYLLANFVK